MASAVASNVHAGPAAAAMTFGWLGPGLPFGARDAAAEAEEPAAAAKAEPAAICKDLIDFEFSLGGSATMLPADELFADGKLLPLRPQATAGKAEAERERERVLRRDTALVAEATPGPVRALHPAAAEAALDPYVFSPKAPTCSSRWRELLRLRKVQTPHKPTPSPSPSASASPAVTPSRASSSSAARSLKLLLLQRNGGRASDLPAAPLLRDSSDSETSLSLASSRFSLSSSSSSSGHDHDDFPRHSLDSVDLTPRPRIRLVRSHHHQPPQPQPQPHPPAAAPAPVRAAHSPARRRQSQSPSPPPPPSVVSVDSPRMNASGKIVFQGLERSSSSPAGSAHSSMRSRSRSRVMDRSYSAGVRATPVVLNVPVCSRPVFGFFKEKKEAAARDAASARARSALGRKTAARTAPPAGVASARDLGSGN
ncbi:uncharacterized LOC100274801 [Zea mays]|uniref:Uncharacterized protein n=1 Tax=Zea mays TaxID=4577 RepID=B6SJF3_MAIZE|nr:uncharacterized LOC100274801 [Zea mays]ACG24986.1 hypothetical protein [Zea mays]|eukprot:NP_001142549.1 uncharacterized protein LOC100274801 [Zea mays]